MLAKHARGLNWFVCVEYTCTSQMAKNLPSDESSLHSETRGDFITLVQTISIILHSSAAGDQTASEISRSRFPEPNICPGCREQAAERGRTRGKQGGTGGQRQSTEANV